MRHRGLLWLLMPFLTACDVADGIVQVSGVVQNEDKMPIAGARVLLSRKPPTPTFETTSDKAGNFQTGGTVTPGYYDLMIRIEAPGYKAAQGTVKSLQSTRLNVILVPKDNVAGSILEVVSKQ
jgi:hypothetical protein